MIFKMNQTKDSIMKNTSKKVFPHCMESYRNYPKRLGRSYELEEGGRIILYPRFLGQK